MSVSDSTDWLNTPLSTLAPLDSALRCQVCKDFFTTPMITSCSHTFCSLCIRRCLSQDGKCPLCRENDQEMKLRRNWVVEELVASFAQSRQGLLDFAKTSSEKEDKPDQRPKKRRKLEVQQDVMERRNTRSQSRRTNTEGFNQTPSQEVIADSEENSEYEDEELETSPPSSKTTTEPNDGLVACPMCGTRMKEQAVYLHLDICTGENVVNGSTSRPSSLPTSSILQSLPTIPKQNHRLPTLNYSMLNENQLRKKLRELGIPSQGTKPLLQKRHTEWLNLWNANCDSRNPQSKRELLADLDTWERSQGRQIANNVGPTGVMVKTFDRDGWVKSNKTDFDDLIRQAREKRMSKSTKISLEEKISMPEAIPSSTQTGNVNVPIQESTQPGNISASSPNHSNRLVDLTSPI